MSKKILVADDSITIQKIVAMAFEKEDAVVEGISNGKEAFDKLGDFQPDIVLAGKNHPFRYPPEQVCRTGLQAWFGRN